MADEISLEMIRFIQGCDLIPGVRRGSSVAYRKISTSSQRALARGVAQASMGIVTRSSRGKQVLVLNEQGQRVMRGEID